MVYLLCFAVTVSLQISRALQIRRFLYDYEIYLIKEYLATMSFNSEKVKRGQLDNKMRLQK